MSLKNLGVVTVNVVAGEFVCYKLELAVSGWQAAFARDKYTFYFTKDAPHKFVRFDQTVAGNKKLSNELISYHTE